MQNLPGVQVHGFYPFGYFNGFEDIFEAVEDFIQDFPGNIERGLNPDGLGIACLCAGLSEHDGCDEDERFK